MVVAIQRVQAGEAEFSRDPLTEALQHGARAWLETMLQEELAGALRGGRHERTPIARGAGMAPCRTP